MNSDITVALITAGFGLMAALTVALIQRHNAVATDVRATREQVQNSHATNLRDDMDALHETARLTLRSVEGLREELNLERRERLAVTARLEAHLETHAA